MNPLVQPINPHLKMNKKPDRDIGYYIRGLDEGNRFVLSESITLLESHLDKKRALGLKLLDYFSDSGASSVRIGITGTPGVGKSTFIEALGMYMIENGFKPAVLAIDPSSEVHKGSILGDKTRMQRLSSEDRAYIRPTASGAVLGGTARHTKETITLCEAAGYNVILVETVGVGQSETEVNQITDINILLLQPGAGDDIQGIKRGVMENADIFVINKADGDQLTLARQTKKSHRNAIRLFQYEHTEWKRPIVLVSSIESTGLDEVLKSIIELKEILIEKGVFESRRKEQEIRWFSVKTREILEKTILGNPGIDAHFKTLSEDIKCNKISVSTALEKMEEIFKSIRL